MSDELKVSASIDCTLSSGASIKKRKHATLDVTGDTLEYGTLSVGTSEEELTQLADLGTLGYLFLYNTDSSNYVEAGHSTGSYCVKVRAGGIALYEHNGATIYLKANTAACVVEFVLIEL